ncbi:GNAT family N-acetyltransferase [Roseomonas harenae]|uniref:GNAT family N-acetyltransferase n=1 Tax=Muricoccus harenae TaxID=2692566 RepID=UPI0013315A93|nr:GNAT family N-acetyltransferase [Roseomonas harenae]
MNATFETLDRAGMPPGMAPVAATSTGLGTGAMGIGTSHWAEVVDAPTFASLEAPWRALCARAAVPNIFMEPAFALAVAEQSGRQLRVLLAWQDGPEMAEAQRLVGVWLVLLGRSRPAWPRKALISPVSPLAYLGTPVLDRDALRPALRALLIAARTDPTLPGLVQLCDLNAELLPDFRAVLREERMHTAKIGGRWRARLLPHPDPKAFWAASMSKTRRQGLERQRRQLAKAGQLEFSVAREPKAISVETEEFLSLEASGWKARRGSALASKPPTAALTRRMIEGLAKQGKVAIHALRLNDQPLAMGIILYSGASAFTWRTAFDEGHRRASPGVLLLEDTTRTLLADPAVAVTDSCNASDVGFQAERWPERQELVDILIDLRSHGGLGIALLAARERSLRRMKATARQVRDMLRSAALRLRQRAMPLKTVAARLMPGR